jgi:hypothetical protein
VAAANPATAIDRRGAEMTPVDVDGRQITVPHTR